MDGTIFFNKLYVIESLSERNLKTGRWLVDGSLQEAQLKYPNLQFAHERPQTKKAFLAVLTQILHAARQYGEFPMIHIECHGCPEGIRVASGEFLMWDEFRDILIEINMACRLNLIVVLAACNGAHLIKLATTLDRAPFWAIIGPEFEIKAGDLLREFSEFYKEFFESLDGDKAINTLNQGVRRSDRKYQFFTAAGLFAKAYKRYHNEFCAGKAKRARIENLTTQAMSDPLIGAQGIRKVTNQIKKGLADDEMHFEKLKNRFFCIDIYPENQARFALSLSDVLDRY